MNIQIDPPRAACPLTRQCAENRRQDRHRGARRQHRRPRPVAKSVRCARARAKASKCVAGGRRLAALNLLAKQKKIASDFPVPCEVRDGADATEISLAENEMREAMHPADQFEAFKKLADEGTGPEEIAARFGTTPTDRRAAPQAGRGQPEADCSLPQGGNDARLPDGLHGVRRSPAAGKGMGRTARICAASIRTSIRDTLTEKHIAADSKLAQFVGVKAYEKAGGAVLRDLFDDENAGWLTDPALVNQLAAEKLEKAAEAVRGEGWKWVEIIPDLTWESTKDFAKAVPTYAAADR